MVTILIDLIFLTIGFIIALALAVVSDFLEMFKIEK